MSKHFKTKVNKAIDFDFSEDDILKLDALQTSKEKYHILKDNTSFKAEIVEADFNRKSYTVKVNNNSYNVNIFNDLDLLIKDMGFSVGTTKQINSILAPMPGLILEINVEVGQEVNENDNLLILEAMKMENIITSPRDGIIKSISIKKGDAVEKNQLLIEFQ
ncbi:acetyl-CoA carboxylase biotin carboxyl carrier protein subunit [Algibacter marinivivus]|uniref:Acetyl-CoA carboxylase biotin carboxyl carrier protein subunit n=1 Tax=Algibacter marinivivus TaxID=2100723 RepID=A0A2U2X4K8_9FLAO|nr:acetyl-CoA carboxylase biotin carboxyl carrier protein subunit [Algibacter marinivivus]PWH82684.1 acetyl-CoA carboxylase biotin carboxyl carrier protein subunit [Algibacter marinivivus]